MLVTIVLTVIQRVIYSDSMHHGFCLQKYSNNTVHFLENVCVFLNSTTDTLIFFAERFQMRLYSLLYLSITDYITLFVTYYFMLRRIATKTRNKKEQVVVSMCIEEHLSRKHSNIANYIARA